MEDKQLLEKMEKMVKELTFTDSTLEKKRIIKKYGSCRELLEIIYDKNYVFNVTGDRAHDFYVTHRNPVVREVKNIFHLLEMLNKRVISGHLALEYCDNYMAAYPGHIFLIIKILNKDLKCGISTKTIESAFNVKIDNFKVPLGYDYLKVPKPDFKQENWFISRKLDGVRVITVKEKGEIQFFSRRGKTIETLGILKKEMKSLLKDFDNIVIDGEICLVDENGNEDFQSIMREIRRKNHEISKPVYYVFDFWELVYFKNHQDPYNFNTKLTILNKIFRNKTQMVKVIDQVYLKDDDHFLNLVDKIDPNWEGFMLRKNCPSLFKRSKNLLKVKMFYEKTLTVIGTMNGEKYINGKHQDCCSSLIAKYKDNKIFIGSGLSDTQRLQFYQKPELIIGKKISVKYFEESRNKMGKVSLRFPVFNEDL